MSGFPSFISGGGFPRSAAEWNNLITAVQRIDRAVFGGGMTGLNMPSGRTVVQSGSPEKFTIYDKFVAIVRTPAAGDTSLGVRELMYADESVVPCTETGGVKSCRFSWVGEAFSAFPLFGLTAMDYEADATPSAADALSPPSDSTILRCFRNHDSWIVDKVEAGGGTAMKPAVITAVGTATVTAQPMKRVGTSWVADGPLLANVPLWGDQTGADFATFISPVGVAPRDFIPLIQLNGEWHAMQYFWMLPGTPSTAPRGDCV